MELRSSLLDTLWIEMGCMYLSDLRYLRSWQKARLVQVLKHTPARAWDLHDWNDALCYLTGKPAQRTAEDARAQLLLALFQNAGGVKRLAAKLRSSGAHVLCC